MKTSEEPVITFRKIKTGSYEMVERCDSEWFCFHVEGQGIDEFFQVSESEATEKDEDGEVIYPDGPGWYYNFMSQFAPETPTGLDLDFHGPFKNQVLAAEDAARRLNLLN